VLVNFLDSPGASKAKKEADTGKITTIGSLMDFDNWIDKFAIYHLTNLNID
jgi:DNA-damage-inducible protein J